MKKLKGKSKHIINLKTPIIMLLCFYPYMVGYSPDSTVTSRTVFDLMAGTGTHSHVNYDCSGNITSIDKFSSLDYGGSITHNIDIFKIGARGGGFSISSTGSEDSYDYNLYYGYVPDPQGSNSTQYFNPFMGAETKYFEMTIGAVLLFREIAFPNNEYLINDGPTQPSLTLRIGNRELFHFTTQYLSNVPLLSGGGMVDLGFGHGSTGSRSLFWMGVSFGPYQKIGITIKDNIPVSERFDILLRGRGGLNEGNFEGGISAGVSFNL